MSDTRADSFSVLVWSGSLLVSFWYVFLTLALPASSWALVGLAFALALIALALAVAMFDSTGAFISAVDRVAPEVLEANRVSRGVFRLAVWNLPRLLAVSNDSCVTDSSQLRVLVSRMQAIVFSSYLAFAAVLVGLLVLIVRLATLPPLA